MKKITKTFPFVHGDSSDLTLISEGHHQLRFESGVSANLEKVGVCLTTDIEA